MRFGAEVRWSPEGVLEGEIATEATPPETFHGVIQLVGLLEAHLGPPPPSPPDDIDGSFLRRSP